MKAGGAILALDIATQLGFAYGEPGQRPISGSVRLAPPGSSMGTKGRGLLRWMSDFTQVNTVDALYLEAPLDPRVMKQGKTTFDTIRVLIGLCFMAEAIAEARGIFHVREVRVQDVRKHFVGEARPKFPKVVTKEQCRRLGWNAADDNAADALALWSFAVSVEAPHHTVETSPLFLAGAPVSRTAVHRAAKQTSKSFSELIDDIEDIDL